jgi:hypothetical protein
MKPGKCPACGSPKVLSFTTLIVSWFSQRITVGESDWARVSERTKIDCLWAYKPRVSG